MFCFNELGNVGNDFENVDDTDSINLDDELPASKPAQLQGPIVTFDEPSAELEHASDLVEQHGVQSEVEPSDVPDGDEVDENVSDDNVNPAVSSESEQPLRRSTRNRRAPGSWWNPNVLMSASCPPDPRTYKEAVSCDNADYWQKAMESEFESLLENGT